ncbi:MAG: hypothetical protein ACOZNI_32305 [Myxococcota bacterium]
MSKLAYVGLDRQIHVVGPTGGQAMQLTSPMPRSHGNWGMLARPQEAWSWPTWSPRGDWIAAFAVEGGDQESGPVRVVALSIDGVRQVEWAQIRGMSPIYLQWHPTRDVLTVLVQQGSDLSLGLLRRERLGQMRPLEQGVPLFFNWTPDGERLLIHVGSREAPQGRLVLRDPLGDGEDVLLEGGPGSFCAPVFPSQAGGARAVYALRKPDGVSEVVVSDAAGHDRRSLIEHKGLLAIVASPKGAQIAVSHAPKGEGTPYRGIDVVDLDTGEVTRVSEGDCLAFFWSPLGDYLLYAVVDAGENCLTWHRADVRGGRQVVLGSFWPTRDILFYLHFFDQYASSHPVISPDGRYVVYAGYPAGGGQADLSDPPRIYVKDVLEADRPPMEIGQGSFAVFSPEP